MINQLDVLKNDLADHKARRAQLADNKGGYFIKREGYPVAGVIASYDKIIADLEAEIAEREGKGKAPKTKKAKNAKTPPKKQGKVTTKQTKKAKA